MRFLLNWLNKLKLFIFMTNSEILPQIIILIWAFLGVFDRDANEIYQTRNFQLNSQNGGKSVSVEASRFIYLNETREQRSCDFSPSGVSFAICWISAETTCFTES